MMDRRTATTLLDRLEYEYSQGIGPRYFKAAHDALTSLLSSFTVEGKSKPKRETKPAVKVFPGGREVCQKTPAGDAEYKRRIEEMWDRDNGICCICDTHVDLDEATFEHKARSRGMGGGKRDDRTSVNGVSHLHCNTFHKGSRSLEEARRRAREARGLDEHDYFAADIQPPTI